jgi:putative oxidoreductase
MATAGSREGEVDSTRLIIPALAGLYSSISPYSYALIRFIVGAIVIPHGYTKLFVTGVQGLADHVVAVLGLPMPLAWAYFLGILECFGGAALAVGFCRSR